VTETRTEPISSAHDAENLLHAIAAIAKAVSGQPLALVRLPAVSGTEKISGVCLVWKCPRCNDVRDFRLVEAEVNVGVLGMKVAELGKMLDLRCDRCRFELKINPVEKPLLAQTAELTKALKEGRLAPADYVAQLTSAPSLFVKHLLALTQNWNCPACGEENPISFDTCWQCSSTASSGHEIPDDAKPFPGLPVAKQPWE
jgi:hypothetical protein